MDFHIYNTLTREKEKLKPISDEEVKIYTCGPTVYNFAHIGNLRTYIFEDILVKALKYAGYKVNRAMNVTDVGHLQSDADEGEDKMALGAKRENKTVWEIARFYEDAFFEDCDKLNIEKPDIVSRATEHIEDMINLIKKLEERGYTYVSNGNVYYEIDKFKDYNKLANLSMEELEAGSRVDVDAHKKNPLDFVLWFTKSKFENQIMQWDSPWGRGFPGWHVECSAMAMRYLGESIDIHCGGVDHIPVHHTNEIAQSEGATGQKWVNYWMHGEFLVLDNGKMSKSKGEFLTLSKLIDKGYDPLVYRFFCLQSRYRKQLVFNWETLENAKKSFEKLRKKIVVIVKNSDDTENKNQELVNKYKDIFSKHVCDDLNVANALTVLYDVIKDNNLSNYEKAELIEDFDRVLSLDLLKVQGEENQEIESSIDKELITKLINERSKARENKNWIRADEIRDELLKMNIELIDTKEGTKWEIKNS